MRTVDSPVLELIAGSDRAAIDPVSGARLASLVAGGRERIVQDPAPGIEPGSIATGSFVMAPFVGRLREGLVAWRGRSASIPTNLGRHAIHGAVFDVPWSVIEASPVRAVLGVRFDAARWPFAGEIRQIVELAPGRLLLRLEVAADDEMPVALGWHPWFVRRRDEAVTVAVESERTLITDDELIPSGRLAPVDARTDLRGGASIVGRRLDTAYADVQSPCVIRWPDLELRLSFDDPIRTVVVFTPPEAFCVEPQTAWPDALRLDGEGIDGTGLRVVPAGGSFAAETTWTWEKLL